MSAVRRVLCAGIVALMICAVSGCGQCGRRLFFFTTVTDTAGGPIAGATVTVDCADVLDAASLTGLDTTDQSGRAAPSAHALNRRCPENPEPHAGYFRSCTVTARATGFRAESLTFSGSELDALPVESAGQAGAGVQVALTLPHD